MRTIIATQQPTKAVIAGLVLLLASVAIVAFPLSYGSLEAFMESGRRAHAYLFFGPVGFVLSLSIGAWTLWDRFASRKPGIYVEAGAVRAGMPFASPIAIAEIERVTLWETVDPLDRSIRSPKGVRIHLLDGRVREIGTATFRETAVEIRDALSRELSLQSTVT